MWNLLKFGTMVDWKPRSGDFHIFKLVDLTNFNLKFLSLGCAAFLNTMTCGLWRITPPDIAHQVANGVEPTNKPIQDVKIGYHFFAEMVNMTVFSL